MMPDLTCVRGGLFYFYKLVKGALHVPGYLRIHGKIDRKKPG